MILLYYLGAGLLIWLSIRSLTGGIRYLRFFQQETAHPAKQSDKFASVFLPCRGLDEGLTQTVAALLEQDHQHYELFVIVDSEVDPAVSALRELITRHPHRVQLLIAPEAVGCSQKIQNLLTGLKHASKSAEVFVFADSDAQPRRDWLRHLLSALEQPGVGAASGYRWYLPSKSSLASELRAAWNASIASALGPNRKANFCWGGSMAIRRELFNELKIQDKWKTAVSDDFVLTRAVREAGLGIAHVPQGICVSTDSCGMKELFEFTTRQMKITRVYSPDLWLVSFIGSAIFNLVLIASIAIILVGSRTHVVAAAVTLALVTVLSLGKAYLRMLALRLALPDHEQKLRAQTTAQLALTMVTPLIFLVNCFAALISRTISWRGTKYELKSPRETVIISD